MTPLSGLTSFPVLHTPRLILRETVLTDAQAISAIFSDEAVTKYHDLPTFTRLDEAVAVIDRRAKKFADGRGIRWAITRKDGDLLIDLVSGMKVCFRLSSSESASTTPASI